MAFLEAGCIDGLSEEALPQLVGLAVVPAVGLLLCCVFVTYFCPCNMCFFAVVPRLASREGYFIIPGHDVTWLQ